MDANLVFGYLLMVLGTIAIAGGIAISIVELLRPRVAAQGLTDDVKSLIEALTKLIQAIGALKGGAQLFVLGLIVFAAGAYLVIQQPL